jgi:hypothetical protein
MAISKCQAVKLSHANICRYGLLITNVEVHLADRKDEKAQAINRRTGAWHFNKLYGAKKNMDKRIEKCK